LLDVHAICEQRDKAVAERDTARATCVAITLIALVIQIIVL
jgi:hypothetical protein